MRRSRPITRTVIMTGVKEESEQQEKKKNNSRLKRYAAMRRIFMSL